MRRRQQLHRLRQWIRHVGVIQIRQQNHQAAALQHTPNPHGRGSRIRLGSLDPQSLQCPPHSRHGRQPPGWRTHHQRPIRKNHEPDTIIIGRDNLRKARRHVRIAEPEPIQRPDTHATEPTGIDGNENVEMLILTQLAGHQPTSPSRCLPVDTRRRVTVLVTAQLMQLRARTHRSPRARPGWIPPRPRHTHPQGIRRDRHRT